MQQNQNQNQSQQLLQSVQQCIQSTQQNLAWLKAQPGIDRPTEKYINRALRQAEKLLGNTHKAVTRHETNSQFQSIQQQQYQQQGPQQQPQFQQGPTFRAQPQMSNQNS